MKSLPLTLLLLPAASAQIRVCGSTYSDASWNCTVNDKCPTGDGCPPDKDTCFNLPEEQCLSPPTASPSVQPMQVCGMDYEDAKSCDRLCEDGCGSMEACFAIAPDECVVVGVSELVSEDVPGAEAVAFLEDPADVSVCGLSFADAAANCETNTPCSPTANDCATGQACFVVPFANCTTTVTGSTEALTVNSTDPNEPGPTTPAPTEPPKEPTHIFVCGVDYDDAELNCNTNNDCPSGDGCLDGNTCFAVPIANCRPATETTVAATATAASDGSMGSTQAAGTTIAPNATVSFDVTTAAADTTEATEEPNLFFCGETYELAQQNCFTAVPCPAGGGCPANQACFGIQSECKSPEPTLSPSAMAGDANTNLTLGDLVTTPDDGTPALSTAAPSLSTVTSAPTKAPIVNTRFCGANYTDALQGCGFDRACPGGFECPSGQTCFTGITCEATASLSTESTPVASPGSTSPTLRGTSTGSTQVTVNLDNLLVFRYCGFSPDDARDNCATATPCLDGSDESCPSMQACFELEEACNRDMFPAFTPVTSPATSAPVTDKPVFDPNITSFCGIDYNDAQENCYYATPCPGNSNAECDEGQTCFPGITTCEIPETPPPTPPSEGANMTDANVTLSPAPVVPTVSPTPKPQYDLSGFGDTDSGRGSGSVSRGLSAEVVISSFMGVIAAFML